MNLCDTCRFHDALQKSCRKNPPTLVMVPTSVGGVQAGGAWPPARDTDWCGAHERDLAVIVSFPKNDEEKANA